MKTLDELGIAPSTWSVRDIVPISRGRNIVLVDADGNDLVLDLDGNSIEEIVAKANIIAAAPEMYEALRDACILTEALSCQRKRKCNGCDIKRESCELVRWRSVLAKAAGEDVVK